jgi:hypothetical protein
MVVMVVMPLPVVVMPSTHEIKSDDEKPAKTHENKL